MRPLDPPTAFRHHDFERTIWFGRGILSRAGEILPDSFALLSTERALAQAGPLARGADEIVLVPPGQVPEVAARLLGRPIPGDALVALGGGRVIDSAKAVAAATGGRPVVAIPTSLSAAEMTGFHRHAVGVEKSAPRVRPGTVINDPGLSASQPVSQLAASSANALGHAIAAYAGERSSPITRAVAGEAATRLAAGWSSRDPDPDELALGALLAGWAVDHSGLGTHHALAQTAVRAGSLGHAPTNAALLPITVSAIRIREGARLRALDSLLGRTVEEVAEDLRRQAPASDLGVLLNDRADLRQMVETAAGRPELRRAEPPFSKEEIEAIYRTAGKN